MLIIWFYAGYMLLYRFMLKDRIKNIFYSLNENKTKTINITSIKPMNIQYININIIMI